MKHLKRNLLLLACLIITGLGQAFAQTVVTVDPGFNTLTNAVAANPGATLILKRGGDYVVDNAVVLTVPTIIMGEKEPVETKPAVVSFFADPGEAFGKNLFNVGANCTLKDFGMMGFTYDEQQIGSCTSITAPDITFKLDGCVLQGAHQLLETNGLSGLTIIQKNNKFFNMTNVGWDSWGGFGTLWSGDNNHFECYNNTFFTGGRAFSNTGAVNGTQLVEHNTYCNTWGDLFFPNYDRDLTIKNNILFNAQTRGYVGVRKAANGDILWEGDWSDWRGPGITDSLCGDVSIFPDLLDSVGGPRVVVVTNNLKMYDQTVMDFYAANNVTPMTFFNVTGKVFAARYGWEIKDNLLQEDGNSLDPEFAMGAIPAAAFELMFKQRQERSLPVEMQGPGYPYQTVWRPGGALARDFIWPLPFDLKPMNQAIWAAGDDSYPLGDLNWFGPEIVEAWEAKQQNPLIDFWVDLGNNKSIICGDSVKLKPNVIYRGIGELSYSWSPTEGLNAANISNPVAFTTTNKKYTLTVTSADFGILKDSLLISVNPLTAKANDDIEGSCGNKAQLNVTTNYTGLGNLMYNWSPSTRLSAANIANPVATLNTKTDYTVEVKTSNGCVATDNLNVSTFVISFNPSICMVTVDENDRNVIVVEKEQNSAIESFLIYRESSIQTDQYDLIGKLPYAENGVFVDSESNAKVQSSKYIIAVKDVCGFFTEKSLAHKTIHLTINKGTDNNWNLIWDPYSGTPVSSYKIYRGTTKSNLVQIGNSSGSNTTYTDLSAPLGNVYYQLEVLLPQACSILKSTEYSSVRSNIISNFDVNVGISENAVKQEFIYPNPASDKLFIRSGFAANAIIAIFDLQGNQVLNRQISKQIDISSLSKGIYTVKLFEPGKVYITKLVK